MTMCLNITCTNRGMAHKHGIFCHTTCAACHGPIVGLPTLSTDVEKETNG